MFAIQMPEQEPAQENAQSPGDHGPHLFQDRVIPLFLSLPFLCSFRPIQPWGSPIFLATPKARPHVDFHDPYGAKEDDNGQDGVGDLVKGGILQVVVVKSDEEGQHGQGRSEGKAEARGAIKGESGVIHETGRVNHGEFVDKLHRVCLSPNVNIDLFAAISWLPVFAFFFLLLCDPRRTERGE